ncbi:HNH endonuclease signature motif containing protein [Streptomyces sp. NPDC058746]|uniref:HNH endonuclease signature motif containing protein n=1 Tax=Streptomyces sp. NPDC058746 TaxID=3346622 RepID=UPI003693ABC7
MDNPKEPVFLAPVAAPRQPASAKAPTPVPVPRQRLSKSAKKKRKREEAAREARELAERERSAKARAAKERARDEALAASLPNAWMSETRLLEAGWSPEAVESLIGEEFPDGSGFHMVQVEAVRKRERVGALVLRHDLNPQEIREVRESVARLARHALRESAEARAHVEGKIGAAAQIPDADRASEEAMTGMKNLVKELRQRRQISDPPTPAATPPQKPTRPAPAHTPRRDAPHVHFGYPADARPGTAPIDPEDERWVSAETLVRQGWTLEAIESLIYEEFADGCGFHVSQVDAVLKHEQIGPQVFRRVHTEQEWSDMKEAITRIALHAMRLRIRRKGRLAAVRKPYRQLPIDNYIRAFREGQLATRQSQQQTPAPEPEPEVPAAPTQPTQPPEPSGLAVPLSRSERAREYQRLSRIAERRHSATQGQRRARGEQPVRNPSARQAVLLRSVGRCENPHCAGQPVDVTDQGLPLLDVDHIDELAAGGADLPHQMIALCPNCHRTKTYGRTRHELIPLLRQIAREKDANLSADTA